MKDRPSFMGVVLTLAGLILSGCAAATETPSQPEASSEVLAARDAALVYVIGHYGEQAPWRNFIWLEQDTTGEGLVGHVAYEYAAGDWVITISYPVVAPEAVVYSVVVANEATGFQWEGEVDAHGAVTEGGEAPSGDVISGKASPESIEILILESFPVQINVLVKGYLSDACTEIDEISQELQGNTFSVTITTARPADAVCAQVTTEFEEVISLDVLGLRAGTYTVDVNDVTDSFELELDNVAPEE